MCCQLSLNARNVRIFPHIILCWSLFDLGKLDLINKGFISSETSGARVGCVLDGFQRLRAFTCAPPHC
jgi:hypothetical protein